MKRKLSKKVEKILNENNITFEIANIEELNEIYKLYNSRINWFKENNINQWSNYIEIYGSKFPIAIKNKNYYILKNNDEIIAGFELSNNPGYFKDNGKSLYLNKVVTKVGHKNIGSYIFMICRDIAKNNNMKYLRLDCIKWNDKLNAIYDKHGFKLVGYGKSDYEYCLRECNVYENNNYRD